MPRTERDIDEAKRDRHKRQMGAALRMIRERAEITVAEQSRRTGISRSTIDRLEAGDSWPTAETLTALLTAAPGLGLAYAMTAAEAEVR